MDTEYVMMCAAEMGEVTPLEAFVLETHPEVYSRIREAVDGNLSVATDFVPNACRAALNQLPAVANQLVGLGGVYYATRALAALNDRLTSMVYAQARQDILGRVPQGYRMNLEGTRVEDAAPLQRVFTVQEGVTESRVREVLASQANSLRDRLTADTALMSEGVAALENSLGAVQRVFEVLLSSLRAEAKALLSPKASSPLLTLARTASPAVAVTRLRSSVKTEVAEARIARNKLRALAEKKIDDARRSIKKAVKLFEQHGKRTVLIKFLDGDEVEMSNPSSSLKFVAKLRSGSLVSRSRRDYGAHTPYDLTVLTKQDVVVGKLCVYISETPILDQLLIMGMFIEAGEEESLLEKGNLFGYDLSVLKGLKTSSPALNEKIARLTSVSKVFGCDQARSMAELIGQDARLQDMNWWAATYEPQVRQWVYSWLEDLVIGLNRCRAAGQLVAPVFERVATLGASPSMLLKKVLGQPLTRGEAYTCLQLPDPDMRQSTRDAIRHDEGREVQREFFNTEPIPQLC